MAKPDPYADIDFEEINDQTNLANDEIKCLKVNRSRQTTNTLATFVYTQILSKYVRGIKAEKA